MKTAHQFTWESARLNRLWATLPQTLRVRSTLAYRHRGLRWFRSFWSVQVIGMAPPWLFAIIWYWRHPAAEAVAKFLAEIEQMLGYHAALVDYCPDAYHLRQLAAGHCGHSELSNSGGAISS